LVTSRVFEYFFPADNISSQVISISANFIANIKF